MNEWPDLVTKLSDQQSETFWKLGNDARIASGTVLITEGAPVDAISFLIEGLLHVKVRGLGERPIAVLGPGEIVGELSFLDPEPASATVTAAEDSHIVSIRHADLAKAFAAEPTLAASFYRSLGVITTRRLRNTMRRISAQPLLEAQVGEKAIGDSEAVQRLYRHFDQFKALLVQYEKAGGKPVAEVSALEDDVVRNFHLLSGEINEVLGLGSTFGDVMKQAVGAAIQRDVLPYMLFGQFPERAYSKPRGYAGDYLTIEIIYKNTPTGHGRLGRLLDRCWLEEPAAHAVRNRRPLMADQIRKTLASVKNRPVHITSMACGPAREVLDIYDSIADPATLKSTLIDMDFQALAFVSQEVEKRSLQRQVRLVSDNLVYLALGRSRLDVPPQDLVYTIGLIDYFNDDLVVKLLNYAYDLLQPGGRVILGNFHPSNPSKAIMDWVLEWRLIHRTEADMHRLFVASKFQRPASAIHFEPVGINLFAEGIKE